MECNRHPQEPLVRREEEKKPQIFQTLRNIDLNLLTIFEAVYVHKGIVNAARVLNLTPSAISQSIQKLRLIFPDPLFIRKGQGVTPTAYASHLHEYISQGLESILGALDFHGEHDKQRTISVATSPSYGALVLPQIYQAIQPINSQLQLRNIAHSDTEAQLNQFQTDLVIDSSTWDSRSLSSHLLFSDRIAIVCRQGHPCSEAHISLEQLKHYGQTSVMLPSEALGSVRKQLNALMPERRLTFSSYNMVTIAAIIGSSDLIGFMPGRLYEMFKQSWNLSEVACDLFANESLDVSLHYNKFSLRDPVVKSVIDAILTHFGREVTPPLTQQGCGKTRM